MSLDVEKQSASSFTQREVGHDRRRVLDRQWRPSRNRVAAHPNRNYVVPTHLEDAESLGDLGKAIAGLIHATGCHGQKKVPLAPILFKTAGLRLLTGP